MGMIDGFWFQIGRALADLVMAATVFAGIMACGMVFVAVTAAWDFYVVRPRKVRDGK